MCTKTHPGGAGISLNWNVEKELKKEVARVENVGVRMATTRALLN
jgi:hypothetical protein